jgi:MutS domain V
MNYNPNRLKKSINKLESLRRKIERKSINIGLFRLFTFFGSIVLILFSYFSFPNIITQAFLVFSIILFAIISVWQSNYKKYLNVLSNWIQIRKSFLSRYNLDWANIKRRNMPNENELSHLEIDFNLTGNRSLIHLIDFSASDEGNSLLRDLFINHKLDKAKIEKRQNIIKDLISFTRFRERFLLILSLLKGKTKNSDNIKQWLTTNSKIDKVKFFFLLLTPIAIVNIVLITLQLLNVLNSAWMISSFIYIAIYYLSNKYYNSIGQVSELIQEDLGKISKVLDFIDNSDFSKYENLQELCEPIQSKDTSPTLLLKKVNRVIDVLSLRSNPFIWFVLIVLFPIDFYIAYKLEKYKIKIGENYENWQNVWHQLEAYVSLATFSKLNSEYKFPRIETDIFEFTAEKIGHPLIPKSDKVENDYSLSEVGNIVIITGSNMSGKSTFLRTLGINICLAYAGAPVNAESFNIPLLRVFSCIKVSDSVIDGISYFYSEVKRLKQLLEEFEKNNDNPIIYFIDEIFKGTNNIERRIGSSAFIKSLIGKNGIGFVTTHDLELVKLSDNNEDISNYHFKENINNNKMEFDYTLHEGPCPTTNALQIMKIEGLPIDN